HQIKMDTQQIQTIVLVLQGIVVIAVPLILLYQNRILKSQVTKQADIINSMKAYADILNLDNIKQYVDMREQTFKDTTEKEKEQLRAIILEVATKMGEIIKTTHEEHQETILGYAEVIAYLVKYISANVLPKNQKTYIERNFPKSAIFILP